MMTKEFRALEEVCEITMGQSPTSSSYNSIGKGLPFFQGKTEFGAVYPTTVKWCSSPKKIAQPNDILLSVRAPVGATNLAKEKCCIGRGLASLRVHPEEIDRDFLHLQLKYLEKYLVSKGQGSTFGAIGADILKNLQIIIPKLNEQKEIATKLNAQLTEIGKARKAVEVALKDLKQLEYMVFENFLSELKNSKGLKIGEYATTGSGSTPSRGNKRYWESGEIPWIKTGEIAFDPITQAQEYVTQQALAECSIKLLPENAVLVAMYGQGKTRGQSAILKVPATINQACFAIYPNDTWHPEFLQLWLRYTYKDLRSMSDNRGGNQANLNGALLNSLEVPAPSIDQQKELVVKISKALQELAVLREGWNLKKTEINSLPNRMLVEAFNNIENGKN